MLDTLTPTQDENIVDARIRPQRRQVLLRNRTSMVDRDSLVQESKTARRLYRREMLAGIAGVAVGFLGAVAGLYTAIGSHFDAEEASFSAGLAQTKLEWKREGNEWASVYQLQQEKLDLQNEADESRTKTYIAAAGMLVSVCVGGRSFLRINDALDYAPEADTLEYEVTRPPETFMTSADNIPPVAWCNDLYAGVNRAYQQELQPSV